jgi:hypothetical protein
MHSATIRSAKTRISYGFFMMKPEAHHETGPIGAVFTSKNIWRASAIAQNPTVRL